MDNVLRRIMEGIRRLHAEWEEKDRGEEVMPTTKQQAEQEPDAQGTPTGRQQAFRRALQTLNRLDTSFRRASWKSGCEMLFPILFGHMSFQTHRCWCVFMRRTIWLGAEAWRRYYGQLQTTMVGSSSVAPQFQLPGGKLITLPSGWREELKDGSGIYIDPDGVQYSSEELVPLALAAFDEERQGGVRGATLRILTQSLGQLREGAQEEAEPVAEAAASQAPGAASTRYHAYDQLDDWHHRGSHPIVRSMSLYEYSRWVYRVEYSPFSVGNAQGMRKKPRHLDMPFLSDYALSTTWIQRLSREPRAPRPEGMKFESRANPEMHYLLKSVLLRPVFLCAEEATTEASPIKRLLREPLQLRLLRSYELLCTTGGRDQRLTQQPGPFEKTYVQYKGEQKSLAMEAERKRILSADYPSLWDTQEVEQALSEAALHLQDAKDESQGGAETSATLAARGVTNRPTVDEYLAAEFLKIDRHFDGIAAAQSGRPKRQIEEDRHVVEEPAMREGGADDDQGDAQNAGADERAQLGLADLKQNLVIRHRFDAAVLEKIVSFQMRERFTKFTKDLRNLSFMSSGELPEVQCEVSAAECRKKLQELHATYEGNVPRGAGQALASLDAAGLKTVVESQQVAFDLHGASAQDSLTACVHTKH